MFFFKDDAFWDVGPIGTYFSADFMIWVLIVFTIDFSLFSCGDLDSWVGVWFRISVSILSLTDCGFCLFVKYEPIGEVGSKVLAWFVTWWLWKGCFQSGCRMIFRWFSDLGFVICCCFDGSIGLLYWRWSVQWWELSDMSWWMVLVNGVVELS